MAKLSERQPTDIIAAYHRDIARWRERGASYKDIQPLTMSDIILIRQVIHPTSRKESKEITKNLIEYICDRGICTAQEIYDHFGYSDKPVLKRLKLFQQFGLVRRESKKWYLPTPRMHELRERDLKRIFMMYK